MVFSDEIRNNDFIIVLRDHVVVYPLDYGSRIYRADDNVNVMIL